MAIFSTDEPPINAEDLRIWPYVAFSGAVSWASGDSRSNVATAIELLEELPDMLLRRTRPASVYRAAALPICFTQSIT